jgi:hypothetical protein
MASSWELSNSQAAPWPFGRAGPDRLADSADQLVGELVFIAAAIEAEGDRCLHVAARRLSIDTGAEGNGPEPVVPANPPS